MVRCALPCVALAVALAACGAKSKPPTMPQVSIPGPTAWDGKPAAGGTVTFISALPGDAAKFVAYEVDPGSCTINRTIVDDLEKLQKLVTNAITNPMDNAGTTSIIRNPPPPPPDGQGLMAEAIRVLEASGSQPGSQACRAPRVPLSPTHK